MEINNLFAYLVDICLGLTQVFFFVLIKTYLSIDQRNKCN